MGVNMDKPSKEEAKAFSEKQLKDTAQSNSESEKWEKYRKWHYGRIDIDQLLDFIYDGKQRG